MAGTVERGRLGKAPQMQARSEEGIDLGYPDAFCFRRRHGIQLNV